MARTPSLNDLDKALAIVAGLAAKSAKLSAAEKQELKALAVKGAKRGQQGLTMVDRARCAWLIRKAGPEKLPELPKLPRGVRRLLRLPAPEQNSTEPSPPLRQIDAVDPLDRLEKLGGLRGKPLTEAQFDGQR